MSESIERIADYIQSYVNDQSRPSVVFKPALMLDGTEWIALYGDDIQVGVVGTGLSPEEAMLDFDKAFYRRVKA